MHATRQWFPVLTAMCCFALGPGIMSIYGFFVEPLAMEFDVAVAVLNVGPVALLLVPGILAPTVGKLADRLPIRIILLIGVSIAMLSLFAIGRAPTLLYVALGFVCFSLGMTLYGPVVINGLMVKLYAGREARALALAAIGISLAAALLPPLVGVLLAKFDWRVTLQSLSVGMLVLLWLAIFAGTPRGVVRTTSAEDRPDTGAFYRNRSFWLIGLCVAMGLNVSIVLAVCYPPFFASRGFTVMDAGWFLAFSGMAGLVGKSCLAWLGDSARRYAIWLAAAMLLLQMAGLLVLYVATQTHYVMFALSLVGIGSGAFIPMHPYLNSRYFDAAIISHVNGAQMPLFLPFGLVGAPLAGYVFDQTGSYDWVMLGLAATLLVAAVLVLRLPPSPK